MTFFTQIYNKYNIVFDHNYKVGHVDSAIMKMVFESDASNVFRLVSEWKKTCCIFIYVKKVFQKMECPIHSEDSEDELPIVLAKGRY